MTRLRVRRRLSSSTHRIANRRLIALFTGTALCAGLGALSVLALSFYQPRWLIRAAEHGFPELLFRVRTDQPLVALTFDDGPDSTVTPRVLEILRREQVLATWFINGSAAEQHPDLLRAILRENHQIANHMWDRTPAWTLSLQRFAASVERTACVAPAGDLRTLLRPASGWTRPSSATWARRNGYRIILGSVYANDPLKPPSSYLTWAITKMARRGDIVVLHVGAGRERTAAALPGMIKGLRAKGLRFARLSDLLDSAAITCPRKRS